MKLLAIVITYYPDLPLLAKNISAYHKDVNGIVIWDNTPGKIDGEFQSLCALNLCTIYARKNGYTHLLTMDQDSVWSNFKQFKEFYIRQNRDFICGPSVNNRTNELLKKELHIITSGTIMPIKILDVIGGYCESFKLDGIDMEVCDRARLFGYDVFSSKMGELYQNFGDQIKKNILGLEFTQLNYSPERIYENAKSLSIIGRAYSQEKYYWLNVFVKIFLGSMCRFVLENQSLIKIKSLIKGFNDGFKFKLKELELNRLKLSKFLMEHNKIS